MVAELTLNVRALLAHHARFGACRAADLDTWAAQGRALALGPGDSLPEAPGACLLVRGRLRRQGHMFEPGDLFTAGPPPYAPCPSVVVLLPADVLVEPAEAALPSDTVQLTPWESLATLLLHTLHVLLQGVPWVLLGALLERGVLVRDLRFCWASLALLGTLVMLFAATEALRCLLDTIRLRVTRPGRSYGLWQRAWAEVAIAGTSRWVPAARHLRQRARRLYRGEGQASSARAVLTIALGTLLSALLSPWLAPRGALGVACAVLLCLAADWRARAKNRRLARRQHEQASFVLCSKGSLWPPHVRYQASLSQKLLGARGDGQIETRRALRATLVRLGQAVALVWLGSYGVRHDRLPLGHLLGAGALWDQVLAAALRLIDPQQEPLGAAAPPTLRRAPRRTGAPAVDLCRVQLRASDGTLLLRDIDLVVQSQEAVLICGPSGAGKTSLVRLLTGLQRPTGGTLRVHGVAPPAPSVAVVGPTPLLWPGTLRDNLRLFSRRRADAELAGAARLVGLNLAQFAQGLNTVLPAEGGLSRLQGVQIALARAQLQQPRLLLLDDALEGLDWQARHTLLQALRAWTPGPALVVLGLHTWDPQLDLQPLRLASGRLVAHA